MSKAIALLVLSLAAPLAAEAAPPREYKIAFIGLRHHTTWGFVERILQGKGGPVKLVGIAETEPELIGEARRRGATDVPVYADANKMLDETKPDIVWGFVENNRHLEVMQACAPRKIHVIYQKPLSATYAEALAIRDLARKHGVQVLVNYSLAFYPTLFAAKAKADSGEIGPVWRMHGRAGHGGPQFRDLPSDRFTRWVLDPVQSGGGALMDFGPYNAMWALWFKGRPQSVFASANHLRPETFPKVEDTAVMVLSYQDGVGHFESSWNFPRGIQDLELFGRGGSLLATGNTDVVMRKGKEPAVNVEVPALGPEMAGPIQYLTHCLENGKPVEGPVSLDLNVGVIEILEAAKKSIETGQAVPLPLPAASSAQTPTVPTDVPAPDLRDVAYGPHARNVLDLWKAPSTRPTPLVIYIHGGGFQQGDKKDVPGVLVQRALRAGFSVASLNYRLSSVAPFPAPMMDGVRAIQFLRSRAAEWNLDPSRFASSGESAGAGISLWAGFHDDFAQPGSADPVQRQSSRLACVGSTNGQTSYDPRFVRAHIGGNDISHSALPPFYGLPREEFATPKAHRLFEAASPINYLTADDPPAFLFYGGVPPVPMAFDAPQGLVIHHAQFGVVLKQKMQALGIRSEVRTGMYDDGAREARWNRAYTEMIELFGQCFAPR